MDPFAAIGLAGNIITFLEFGFKLVSTAKGIHDSASGTSLHNEGLASLTQQLQTTVKNLHVSKPVGSISDQERALHQTALECEAVSSDLVELLDRIKAKNSKSKRESFRAAFREWRRKDDVAELESKLNQCRQQLNLQISGLSRSEATERLSKLLKYGQATEVELGSLARSIESLRQGSSVSCMSPESLDQIRSVLSLTEEAVTVVRQTRVLEGLRFELMNERQDDIEEAHHKTFDWLLTDDDAESSRAPSMSRDEKGTTTSSVHSDNSDHDELEKREDISNVPQSLAESDNDSICTTGFAASSDGLFRPVDHQEHNSGIDKAEESAAETDLDDDSSFPWAESWKAPTENDFRENESDVSDSELTASTLSSVQSDRLSIRSSTTQHVSRQLCEAMAKTRERFITWLAQGDGIFHISGKPGSGKSTLMKYICGHTQTEKHLRIWADSKVLVTGRFFFWKPGTTLQKSLKGLFRGLLYYFLETSPDLIPIVFPQQWEASIYKEKIHFETHECQQGFETLISVKADYKKHKYALFIDGLDEFEGSSHDLIRKLFDWTKSSGNVKICVSSREWSVFQEAFQNCPKLRLHELTRSDIQRFVHDRLTEMGMNTLGVFASSQVERQVLENSDGVFLWVTLVLRHIETGLSNGDLMEDVMEVINTLPTELEPMLHQLLGSIPATSRKLAYAMLSFASISSQYDPDMRLMQYSFVEEYTKDRDFAVKSSVLMWSPTQTSSRLQRTAKRIYGVCKGFLELRRLITGNRRRTREIINMHGDVVHFTHRSIVEFLQSDHFRSVMDQELPGFDLFDAYCQTYLGLLKSVNLPTFYFAPSLASQDKMYGFLIDSMFTRNGKHANALFSWFRDIPSPSYRRHITRILLSYFDQGKEEYSLRFCSFLDNIQHTLNYRHLNDSPTFIAIFTRVKSSRNKIVIPCRSGDIIPLFCFLTGFQEYLNARHPQDISVISKGIGICLSLNAFENELTGRMSKNTKSRFKSAETLFALGDSLDASLSSSMHTMARGLLEQTNFWTHPPLDVIAFLLNIGISPKFVLRFSKKQYKAEDKDEESWGSRIEMVFKVYLQVQTLHLPMEPLMGIRLHRTDPGTPASGLVAMVSPKAHEVIVSCDHSLAFRDLLPLWFPEQGPALQRVVDWIDQLGVPVDKAHRARLQEEFGHILRPLFEGSDPDGVDSVIRDGADAESLESDIPRPPPPTPLIELYIVQTDEDGTLVLVS